MGGPKRKAGPARRGVHVALLRGINLGGKNRLPMASLVQLFESLGCADVRTYIQSGNVVFAASDALAEQLPRRLAALIEARLGLRVPVITRSGGQLAQALAHNPFVAAGVDPGELSVMFLADAPSAAHASQLDAARSPPDELVLAGRDIYLRCPNGLGRSKLTNAYFDRVLRTTSTCRNWRTVEALVALAR